ncbi:MAG: hypothetical protein SRB2_04645 [Desulfobacteraceae bacterium Eth-SRB2]|nr:MAG: hypothetical protein SRB2_04645 [Desulfobacteraceae bacterium Eth-SRB2]
MPDNMQYALNTLTKQDFLQLLDEVSGSRYQLCFKENNVE